ncbi:MAG TPA: matrixin family metalloprotease, partial [Bryobacteraceae bacterium]|nr:matrixin family metalloprotease [Bryobacteraceae bacterium]
MNRALKISAAIALSMVPAFGYIRSGFSDGGVFFPIKRGDNKGIQFYINNLVVPGATSGGVKVISDSSDPVTAIREAAANWNRVPGADIKFLSLRGTDLKHDVNDNKSVVMIAATADDVAAVGGAVAITATFWYPDTGVTADGTAVVKGQIVDSDILLNPAGTAKDLLFSTDGSSALDLQAVITHELGHALGENHTEFFGSTMFPFVGPSQRIISSDEQAFAQAVYPAAGTALGTISGKITASGGSAAKAALVGLIDPATGVVVGTMAGSDGTYSIAVPAGNYIVYAEPFNNIFQAGNVYSLDPAQVTKGLQPTFLGGAASPTRVTVNSGATATADVEVAAAGGAVSVSFITFGTAGASGSGDLTTPSSIVGSVILQSGRSLDIGFVGSGIDGATTIQVIGASVSVRAGSTRVDPKVNLNGSPLVRATLDIAARETPSMATLVITKGNSTIAYSGYFVIVPPKPVFTSKSIVNAASYVGLNGDGVVSPGGLYSIYAAPGSALGPAAFQQNGDYDGYGKLANSLAGVTVTFDGVLAPMFLSYSGQLNLQVPFEVAGKSTTAVRVNYNGSLSDAISVPVTPSQPAFFTVSSSGGADS